MKKKMVSLMMATTLMAGLLSGCGGNSTPAGTGTNTNAGTNTDSNANTGDVSGTDANTGEASGSAAALPEMTTDEITLTYMHFDSEQLVNRVADAFMAKYPNIKVEAQAFSTDGYNDTLLNLVQSGQTPCLLYTSPSPRD